MSWRTWKKNEYHLKQIIKEYLILNKCDNREISKFNFRGLDNTCIKYMYICNNAQINSTFIFSFSKGDKEYAAVLVRLYKNNGAVSCVLIFLAKRNVSQILWNVHLKSLFSKQFQFSYTHCSQKRCRSLGYSEVIDDFPSAPVLRSNRTMRGTFPLIWMREKW